VTERDDPLGDLVVHMSDVGVRRGTTHLLAGVNWSVELDERWVILGANGAGKTTLLRLAAAELHPTSGQVHVLGEQLGRVDVRELRTRVGFCSAALLARVPPGEKVIDIVVSAGYAVLGRWREEYEQLDTGRAQELCKALGIAHLAERLTELAYDPDAPTTILVTHHVEEIPPGFTHLMLLADGGVVAQGLLDDVLTGDNLSATFGQPLMLERLGDRYFARRMGSH
jgi:iron complex transport system ATP-binding protein